MNRTFVPGAIALTLLTAGIARAQVAGFADVPKGHWAAEGIARLAAGGVLKAAPADPVGGERKSSKPGYDGNKPVTRYELAAVLYRFVQYLERADKQKKNKMGADATPRNGQKIVRWMVAEGYLPNNTPLANEGGKVVTAEEMRRALATVIVRVREKKTPISPDSEHAGKIERPSATPAL